jgi:streptogramin lyase
LIPAVAAFGSEAVALTVALPADPSGPWHVRAHLFIRAHLYYKFFTVIERLNMTDHNCTRGIARGSKRTRRRIRRDRPLFECLEGRVLLSLNAFPIPAGTQTAGITTGSDGNLWFTESASNQIGRITPAGVVTEFKIPTAFSGASAITTGPDGNVYFVESEAKQIGRITPKGVITEFAIPASVFAVGGITAGPDGNVYFSVGDNHGAEVGRLTPAGKITFLNLHQGGFPGTGSLVTGPDKNLWVALFGEVVRLTTSDVTTAFPLPTPAGDTAGLGGIAAGPDGNLWFTGDNFSNGGATVAAFVGRITTKGVATEFPLATADSFPTGISAGSDGNLYSAGTSAGAGLSRITTQGVITELPVPTSGGVTKGPDGNIWLTEDGKIAQFVLDGKPANPNVSTFPVPAGTETAGITTGSDGNLWFTESASNQIGRITPAGVVTEFKIPTAFSGASAITTGSDGNVYFVESEAKQIGRITPTGVITEFAIPASVFAVGGITAGPDGNVYFSVGDNHGAEVGRLTPAGKITFLNLHQGGFPGTGSLVTGPDKNLWVALFGEIVRLTTSDVTAAFPLPTPAGDTAGVGGITAGPDGNLWFTGDNFSNGGATVAAFIGRMTTKGVATEFPIATADSLPSGITAGTDGNLYFADMSSFSANGGGDIGRVTTSGVITELPVPASGGITAGPDGNVWLTEDGKIARIALSKTAAPASISSTTQGAVLDVAIEALFPDDGPELPSSHHASHAAPSARSSDRA